MSHRYLLRLTALVSGLVLLGAAPATAGRELHGRQVGPAASRLAWSDAGTYVLGDSITAEGTAELQARRPRWTINGLHGRPVSTLPLMVANVRAVDQRPFRVVVELGSNQSPAWSKSDYRAAIDALPTSTRVLLVTPYKQPGGHWAPKGVQATTRYARWMQQVARERPHTCVVPWRAKAAAHPEWLRDGLHPTDDGYAHWADLILETDSTCR
ncbi:hypothetical protein GCM10009798_09990 [Nocardioides panacihumi]|uniref:SGNH hydrolase-type esterase domain-containing protein n=1 Tax=Nocardioides panacihumi TaxID=400774 RepID=A0ABN2QIY3_9ACTN